MFKLTHGFFIRLILFVFLVVNANTQMITGTMSANRHLVYLSWIQGTAPITGNDIYRSTVHGGPYTLIYTSVTPLSFYYDNPVEGTYYYVVDAYSYLGNTPLSNETVAIVPGS